MISLTQWLCPQRHCSIALLWDSALTSETEMIAQGEAVFTGGALNRHCGLCGGPLTPETGATQFKTMSEAEAFGRAEELKTLASRVDIELLKQRNKN